MTIAEHNRFAGQFSGALLILMLLTFAAGATAARDGELDENRSEASIRVSLAILPSVQIAVSGRIDIDIRDTRIDTVFTERVCITGPESGRYQLAASGSHGDYLLRNENGDPLPFDIAYREDTSSETFQPLQHGEPSAIYSLKQNRSECSDDGNLRIAFRSNELQRVNAGLYTGALTLLVSPL